MQLVPPRQAPRSYLSRVEKIFLSIAVILLLAGVIGYFIDRQSRKNEQPIISGTYTEGVIADSPTKVDRLLAQLTNIGLTYREHDGSIQPALAQSWDVSPDNKTYTFHLRTGYSASGLLGTIQSGNTNWQGITITAPEESTLQFVLNEPLNVFLGTTTDPLFPFGPYKVVKRDKNEIVLRSNEEFALGPVFIPKVVIKPYESVDELVKAARAGEINGTADFADTVPKSFQEYIVKLPRYHILFFNLTRPVFKRLEDRQRVLAQTDGAPVSYRLLTTQSNPASELADTFAKSLASSHITLTVDKKNSLSLQKEDIPKRDFDLLLYGVNYGIEPDYYSFWHSSQASGSGLNISGLKDKELDQLLESARHEQDANKRVQLNNQIEAMLDQKALRKVIDQEEFRFWVDRSVKGVKYGTMDEGSERFNLIWQWYIKAKKVR